MRRLILSSSCLALPLLFACADSEGPEGSIDADEAAGTSETDDEVGESATSTVDGDGDVTTTDGPDTDATDDTPTTDTTNDATTDDATTDDATTDDATDDTTTGGDGDADLTFIVMGDAGEGNDGQYNVADAIEMVCADVGDCAFVLYLGDNFYDDGVENAMDDQFQTKFEMPYADLDMPFKIVLGNHDYGQLSFAWEKSAYEIEYTNYSDKWELPSEYYSFSEGGADFFVMDTTRFMWNHETSEQQNWIDGAIGASNASWKIAAAHHPYYSNGEHGNAGNYEGFPFPPQLAGTTVKEVLDDSVCGKVDVYFAGHDHNRQWHQQTCDGTHIIVSGAGSKTTEFAYHDDNDVYWEDDTTPGFMLVQITGNTMHTAFYDEAGTLEFERDIVK